jgi:hypothetical protein
VTLDKGSHLEYVGPSAFIGCHCSKNFKVNL